MENPYTLQPYRELEYISKKLALSSVHDSTNAQQQWAKQTTLAQRQDLCLKWIDVLETQREQVAKDISLQMGKPLSQV